MQLKIGNKAIKIRINKKLEIKILIEQKLIVIFIKINLIELVYIENYYFQCLF